MIGRIIFTAIIVAGSWAVSTWLYLVSQAYKAEFAVMQIEDSNVTSATVRWLSGDMPSTVVIVAAFIMILLIWKKPITNLFKQTEKEN